MYYICVQESHFTSTSGLGGSTLSKKCQNRRTLYCECGAQADVPCGEREELPAAGEPLQGHPLGEHRHQGGEDLQVVPALME